jgi:hypothetical protein
MIRLFFIGIIVLGIVIGGRVLFSGPEKNSGIEKTAATETAVQESAGEIAALPIERKATVYKAPNCGCCNGYIAELKRQGYEVDVKSTQDMGSIKEQYGIEEDKQSCHTTVIGDYFVEGHVPLIAVEKLLSEKPDIDGIGLPGMPIGTPGMPGKKQAPYEVYQKEGNNFTQFVTL